MVRPEIPFPKQYQPRDWQGACKVGRSIYMFGGQIPRQAADQSSGKMLRLNVDEFVLVPHESLNHAPLRWAHVCAFYSTLRYRFHREPSVRGRRV